MMGKVQDEIKSVLRSKFEYRIKIFSTKIEYVKEHSKISKLNFIYIKDSFGLFLIVNLMITGLFILDHISKKFVRSMKK